MQVDLTAGHSSIPPKRTATGTLARALGRLEQNPQPNLFGMGPEQDLFKTLSCYVIIIDACVIFHIIKILKFNRRLVEFIS